jgi:hypothetical protein
MYMYTKFTAETVPNLLLTQYLLSIRAAVPIDRGAVAEAVVHIGRAYRNRRPPCRYIHIICIYIYIIRSYRPGIPYSPTSLPIYTYIYIYIYTHIYIIRTYRPGIPYSPTALPIYIHLNKLYIYNICRYIYI